MTPDLLLSPAAIIKEIGSYKFSLFGRLDSRGPIVLYDTAGERIAHIFFQREGSALPDPQVLPDGIVYLNFYYADFPLVIDLLRNEKDRILVFVDKNNCRISTGI